MKFFLSLIVFVINILLIWESSARASYQEEEITYLSLAEVIHQIMENNFEIELARLSAAIGATHLPLQKAIFEPHLRVEGFESAVNRLKLLMNDPSLNNNIVPTEELTIEDKEIIPDVKLQEALIHRRAGRFDWLSEVA